MGALLAKDRPDVRQRTAEELLRFGANIRRLRDARGWTLEQAAERIGFSLRTLWRLEQGKRPPAFESIVALAVTYRVEISSLFS